MAKVQIKMPEDFLLKLSRLGNKTDEITPKVLEAGGEVVLEKVRSNLQAVIGRDTKEDPALPASWCPPSAFPRPRLTGKAITT